MNFSAIVEKEFPKRAIRIVVGDTQTYLGINSDGLNHLKTEQLKWLNSHKIKHLWYSIKEVEIVFQKSKKYNQIVWGKI